MYFIVYVIQSNRYLVVPISWISSVDTLIEYFINYSVNSNKQFSFFWTDNPLAFNNDGLPRTDYLPNVHAGSNSVFPSEGWYRCQIKRFFSSLPNAVNFSNQRRMNVGPAVYNALRLRENPLGKNPPKTPRLGCSFASRLKSLSSESRARLTESMLASSLSLRAESTPVLAPVSSAASANLIAQAAQHSNNSSDANCHTTIAIGRNPGGNSSQSSSQISTTDLANESPIFASIDSSINRHVLGQVPSLGISSSEENSQAICTSPVNLIATHVPAAQHSNENRHTTTITGGNPGGNSSQSSPQFSTTDLANESPINSSTSELLNSGVNVKPVLRGQQSDSSAEHNESNRRLVEGCRRLSVKEDTTEETVFSSYERHSVELSDIFNQASTSHIERARDDDDCIMIWEDTVTHFPLSANPDGLIKYENDVLSGNIPFIITRNGRIYKVGDRLCEIHNDVLTKLLEWNSDLRNHNELDFPFALAIFLSLVPNYSDETTAEQRDAMEFVLSLLRIRTNLNDDQVNEVGEKIRTYCKHAKKR